MPRDGRSSQKKRYVTETCIRFRKEEMDKIEEVAHELGVSKSEIVRRSVLVFLEDVEKKEKFGKNQS